MSRILSRISMLTGQISSHALHDVQAHTSSGVMRSNSDDDEMVISGSRPMGVETTGSPERAMTSPVLSTISRGSSGLPVAWAGHTEVQRPHMVQASVSSSCFQVKSSTVAAPNVSSSVSIRLGIAFMAPLGRSLSRRYMLSGDVKMCRSMVTGRMTTNSRNDTTWAIHQPWCQPEKRWGDDAKSHDTGAPTRQRVADDRPVLEVGTAGEGDAVGLGAEAGDADGEERAEDDGVLGLGLDADAVGPLHVAPHDGPDAADQEQGAGHVAHQGVGPVHVAVEELRVLGHLVVDLEHRGDGEEDDEVEVDQRVHDAGGRVAQQRLHVDAGT